MSAIRALASHAAAELHRPPRQHLLQQRDVPLPAREQRRELGQQRVAASRASSGRGRGSRSGRAGPSWRRSVPRLPRHLLTGAELTRDDVAALLHRASELKASPRASRALARTASSRCCSRSRARARALSFEAGVVELGGHPMILRGDEMQLSRGESVKDTARILSRARRRDRRADRGGRDPRGARGRGHGARVQHAHGRPPPVPGARRPDDAAGDLRPARGAASSPTSATATTSPGRWPSSARSRASRSRSPRPPATQLEPVAGAHARRPTRREAVAGARAVYADVWVSMGDEETADARRAALGAVPHRRRAARPRRARRDRAALPARAPRRGDHRRGALRRRASASGTRPRTAGTRRRRCSSGSCAERLTARLLSWTRCPLRPPRPAPRAATSSTCASTASPTAARRRAGRRLRRLRPRRRAGRPRARARHEAQARLRRGARRRADRAERPTASRPSPTTPARRGRCCPTSASSRSRPSRSTTRSSGSATSRASSSSRSSPPSSSGATATSSSTRSARPTTARSSAASTRPARGSEIVRVEDCLLASERGNAARRAALEWCREQGPERLRPPRARRACCATSSCARGGAPARSRCGS